MTDLVDDPAFMLLVPVGRKDLTELHTTDMLKVEPLLTKHEMRGPVARVNLGEGRMACFGIGPGMELNPRARRLLEQWGTVSIELSGPVIFAGISANQAMALMKEYMAFQQQQEFYLL